jgi:hypothetical protein
MDFSCDRIAHRVRKPTRPAVRNIASPRVTEVNTTYFKPNNATDSSTFFGSSGSNGIGVAISYRLWQNPQLLVIKPGPISKKVAVRWLQHPPLFGQRPSSQIVRNAALLEQY